MKNVILVALFEKVKNKMHEDKKIKKSDENQKATSSHLNCSY